MKKNQIFNPENINERILKPELIDKVVLGEHMTRYNFASQYVQGKKVLDCGCAGGYGTNFLSQFSEKINAIDLSGEAIAFAKKNFPAKNIDYFQMDATKLKFKNSQFDVVVSFEVIEHVKNQDNYLNEISRVLKAKGLYIGSTPNAKVFASINNPFHEKELVLEEYRDLLKKHFSSVEIFGQKHKESFFEKALKKIRVYSVPDAISKSNLEKEALYFVAICRK